ncbi:cysteine-rich small domain-containing protein [Spirochaetota bacterium]
MKNSYRYFNNPSCKYYPCHSGINDLNCLFCYCPLYFIEKCGGNYTYTKKGIKNCSECTMPHKKKGYEYVLKVLKKYEYLKNLATQGNPRRH